MEIENFVYDNKNVERVGMKTSRKVLIYLLMLMVYILIVYIFISKNMDVDAVLNGHKYVSYECREEDVIEANDCVLNEGKIEFHGEDPYLVFQLPEMMVGKVSVRLIQDYPESYKVYYTLHDGFSENKVAVEDEKDTFIVGKRVRLIRVDLEEMSPGMEYKLVDDVKISLNDNIGQPRGNIVKALYVFAGYVIMSSVYILYLGKKNRFFSTGITYIYNLLMSCIWITSISQKTDIFINIVLLLLCCAGLAFWGNLTILEEKK